LKGFTRLKLKWVLKNSKLWVLFEDLMVNDEVVIKGKLPWEKDEKIDIFRVKKEKNCHFCIFETR
jgi:hypothetical protein